MPKEWITRPFEPAADKTLIESWSDELGVSPFLTDILWRRGVKDLGQMDRFLSPGLRHLAPPSEWPGLDQAAEILARELTPLIGREKPGFAVWGDYDVDGVTASALVKDFLSQRGLAADHFLPDRVKHGYGVNIAGVEELAARGIKVLLTVDCGVSDIAPIARARELGVTVVVSDHHLPGPELPPAHALVNPRLADCPCPHLAGVGVAFFLMAGLNRLLPGEPVDIRPLLDLAALGTLADVVKLTGQNRILVKNGLLLLAEARRPGIAALKEAAGFGVSDALGAGQVVFGLAPRINAAGRMDRADQALELLLAPDIHAARPLAARLETLNRDRRQEEDRIRLEAMAQAEELENQPGLVLFSPDWRQGVVGIVASRIVESFYKPVLILSEENGLIKGSGRSVSEFDIFKGISSFSELLVRFGGHRQAAGLSLKPENLDPVRQAFVKSVVDQIGETRLAPKLKVDQELNFKRIDFTLLKELELLQPFGVGNPEPVFTSPPLQVMSVRTFGKEKAHAILDLMDSQAGIRLRGKAWRMARELPPGLEGKTLTVAFTPKIDRYGGLPSIDLSIKDWRLVD